MKSNRRDSGLNQRLVRIVIEGIPLRNTLYVYINPKIASAEYKRKNLRCRVLFLIFADDVTDALCRVEQVADGPVMI